MVFRLRKVTVALAAAAVLAVGAAGTVAAYWAEHHATPERVALQEYFVEADPVGRGAYTLYVPIPATRADDVPPGFGVAVAAGAPRFSLVETEHGVALRIVAEGPFKLRAQGDLPFRFSLEDPASSFKQFRFFAFLARDATGPVSIKVEVRERVHNASWNAHVDSARAIILQDALAPTGWQTLRATQLFDLVAAPGYGSAFPRVALGGVVVATAGLYMPAGIVVARSLRREEPAGPAATMPSSRP